MNVHGLKRAIAELIAFLGPTNSTHWIDTLSRIHSKLGDPTTVRIARRELESCFGGMGPLNDLYLCEQNGNLPPSTDAEAFNAEFSRLMDTLFRENRLAGASLFQRLQWRYYEFKHRGDLAPRIKKTFA